MLSFFKKQKHRTYLRPPGARSEHVFSNQCIRCQKCIQVCPHRCIVALPASYGLKQGSPAIFARDIPCYLCMDCPPACPTGALEMSLSKKEDVRMGTAIIDESLCLPYQGVICRTCYEHCPIYREGIILEDERFPKVQPDQCVGCGICEHVCPAEELAIQVRPGAGDGP